MKQWMVAATFYSAVSVIQRMYFQSLVHLTQLTRKVRSQLEKINPPSAITTFQNHFRARP
jgi:hypothetical protein